MRLKIAIMALTLCLITLLPGCSSQEVERRIGVFVADGTSMVARTDERYFEVFEGEEWRQIYIKGVNVGTSLPGGWYTEFPADRALYRSWLEKIADMNINVVRLYTLLDPAFYNVFREFNMDPDNPRIWLMQEVWPHDDVPDLNFHDPAYKRAYMDELKLVVDALHGNVIIPGRPHRAYGVYTADVSPFVLGVLVGREFEPDEVQATDKYNPFETNHAGDYVLALDASPTEVWLAQMCDLALEYAQSKYSWQYPVGFVSWPTLDPLRHPTEWESPEITERPAYNDREEVRPHIFEIGAKNKAGFFGAYHIYPNYPDFMNMEPAWSQYSDEEGRFRYIGYLKDFMAIHPPYPAVVAEFGISTSLNTAHLNPDGLNHGGLSEEDLGHMTVRMMKAIINEGYAGGIVFEWTDEWAKKTWNTEPYMVPWERQVLWKNAMDPEQNYGILSMEPSHIPFRGSEVSLQGFDTVPLTGNNHGLVISALEVDANEAFLFIVLTISGAVDWNQQGLAIGIDTGIREAGELKLPIAGTPLLPTGVEFLVRINSPDDASIEVIPSYNRATYSFSPRRGDTGKFVRIEPVVNRERFTLDGRYFPALRGDQSALNYGQFDPEHEEYNSLAHWYIEPDATKVVIRLPWMVLGVSDPSSAMIINDDRLYRTDPLRDQLRVQPTEGFLFYPVLFSETNSQGPVAIDYQPRVGEALARIEPYLWTLWEEPLYTSRLKRGHRVISEFFAALD